MKRFIQRGKHGNIRDERDISHKLIAFGPRVASEHLQFSLILREAQDRVEGGGLACAVGADESENAALFDVQVDAIECDGCAEGLAKTACFDDCHGWRSPCGLDLARFGLMDFDDGASEDGPPFVLSRSSSAVKPSR